MRWCHVKASQVQTLGDHTWQLIYALSGEFASEFLSLSSVGRACAMRVYVGSRQSYSTQLLPQHVSKWDATRVAGLLCNGGYSKIPSFETRSIYVKNIPASSDPSPSLFCIPSLHCRSSYRSMEAEIVRGCITVPHLQSQSADR